jgi:hypothetical protein
MNLACALGRDRHARVQNSLLQFCSPHLFSPSSPSSVYLKYQTRHDDGPLKGNAAIMKDGRHHPHDSNPRVSGDVHTDRREVTALFSCDRCIDLIIRARAMRSCARCSGTHGSW